MIVLLYAKYAMHCAKNLDKKVKRANQIKCRKQPRPSQLI